MKVSLYKSIFLYGDQVSVEQKLGLTKVCPDLFLMLINPIAPKLTVPNGTELQICFQDWWAEVTHGAKNNGSFSEMMGPSISN